MKDVVAVALKSVAVAVERRPASRLWITGLLKWDRAEALVRLLSGDAIGSAPSQTLLL